MATRKIIGYEIPPNPLTGEQGQSTTNPAAVFSGGTPIYSSETSNIPTTTTQPNQVIRNEQGGLTGLTTPQGLTLTGLSDAQTRALASIYAQRAQTPPGFVEASQTSKERAQLEQNIGLSQQVGENIPNLPVTEKTPTRIGETLLQGSRGAITGALSAGILGGASKLLGLGGGGANAASAGLRGNLALAGVAALAGSLSGISSNLASQRSDNLQKQKSVLTDGKEDLSNLISLARADPRISSRIEYVRLFNRKLAEIEKAHSQMKLDTQKDYLKYNTAIPDLQDFANFYSTGGEQELLIREMQEALLNPQANIDELIALGIEAS